MVGKGYGREIPTLDSIESARGGASRGSAPPFAFS